MPPSYKALLQSIDETDVSKGLGRSIKAPRRRKCFCCRRLCLLCTCIILMILIPVLAILGVYLVSPTSLLPFKEWFHWDDIHWFQPIGNLTSNSTNYNHTLNATNDQIDENTTQLTPSEYVQQVIDWTVEKIDDIPKIPLIISLSLSGLVLFTLIWLAVYRRVIRRQRRRHIAKLVTDLQSGDKAFLLNSDESDDD